MSEIPAEARICFRCGSYQNRWRNFLRFLGGFAGVLAIVAGAATYVFTNVRELAAPGTVEILDFSRREAVPLFNPGFKDIFVASIVLRSDPIGWNLRIPVNRVVEPGKIKLAHPPDDVLVSISNDNFQIVEGISRGQFDQLLKAIDLRDKCIFLEAFRSDGLKYEFVSSSIGKNFNTFEVEATVTYLSGDQGSWHEKPFPAVGTLLVLRADPIS